MTLAWNPTLFAQRTSETVNTDSGHFVGFRSLKTDSILESVLSLTHVARLYGGFRNDSEFREPNSLIFSQPLLFPLVQLAKFFEIKELVKLLYQLELRQPMKQNGYKMPFMPIEETDAALVSCLGAQDETALSKLYDRYSGVLYGLASKITGSAAQAEEVVQDVFLKLWRNPKGFDPSRAALSTYLITLVRNASIDALRRNRPSTPLEDEEGDPLPLATTQAGPLERAELGELAVRVRAAMQGLSAAHRQTVELAYFQGASREEIAETMGVPVGTVKSRLKYALDKLRETLHDLDAKAGEP